MSFSNPYIIEEGKYEGCKRLSIDSSTATTHDLITPESGHKIRVLRALISIEGDNTQADLKEEGDAVTMYGPVFIPSGATSAVIKIDPNDGIKTKTADKKLQLTLTNTQPISGTIIYVDVL